MAIHEEVLETARRICRERREKSFRVADIVHALPHLNPSSVRTHVVSRCCPRESHRPISDLSPEVADGTGAKILSD